MECLGAHKKLYWILQINAKCNSIKLSLHRTDAKTSRNLLLCDCLWVLFAKKQVIFR